MIKNNVCRKYLKNVKKILGPSFYNSSPIFEEFCQNVIAFSEENTSLTLSDYENEFGTAKEIAKSFYSNENCIKLQKSGKKVKHLIFTSLICIAITLVIAIFMFIIWDDIFQFGTITNEGVIKYEQH